MDTKEIMDTEAEMRLVIEALSNKKAEDCIALDMTENCFCDYFVICSGSSTVMVRSLADEVLRVMRSKAERKHTSIEGYRTGEWVLIDYGTLVVHIFKDQAREYYALEELWADAPIIEFTGAGNE